MQKLVRHAAKLLHGSIFVDPQLNTVSLTEVRPHAMADFLGKYYSALLASEITFSNGLTTGRP